MRAAAENEMEQKRKENIGSQVTNKSIKKAKKEDYSYQGYLIASDMYLDYGSMQTAKWLIKDS